MRRWIGLGLCISLAIAALVTAVVAFSSYWNRGLDYEFYTNGQVFNRIEVWKGSVGVAFIRRLENIYASDAAAWNAMLQRRVRDRAFIGFHYVAGEGASCGPTQKGLATKWRTDATEFLIPGWLAVAILGAFPTLWFRRLLRERIVRRRGSRGLCLQCGYDLRATLDRCPECGAGCEAAGS